MDRLRIDPLDPDPAVLERAAGVVRRGGVVALPTDTLYGLAIDPFNRDAIARVLAIKQRDADRGVPLVASHAAQVEQVGVFTEIARRLADRYWPGPLTLLIPALEALPSEITGGTRRVAVRVPAHAVARGLCRVLDRPLSSTSANISGQPATADPDVAGAIPGLDLLLDAGETPGGPPSTIVDTTGDEPRLLREGAVEWASIQTCLQDV
jgi:L-threonylcarbamoyladenylate synthase